MEPRILTNDADTLAFLQGQLEFIEPRLYEVKYRNILYAEHIPVDASAGPWAEAITFESVDSRTKAQFFNPSADDIPYVDVGLNRNTIPVQHAALGYSYTTQELRVAAQTGRPLDSLRGTAVQRGVDELAQRVAFLGAPEHNLPGFLNNALITPGSPTTGSWISGAVSDRLILQDINEAIVAIWDGSNTVEMPNTVLLPPAEYGHIAGKPIENDANTTVLKWLKDNNIYSATTGQPLTIMPLGELDSLGAGSTQRMVVYRKAPEVLTFHFPMPLQFQAPQIRDLTWHIPGEFRISGTQIRYPGAVSFTDGI